MHTHPHSHTIQEKELEKLKKKKDTTRLMAADTANFQALKQVYDKQEHPEQGDRTSLLARQPPG
jgi:hypothetical protein